MTATSIPTERLERYVNALRAADVYALVPRRDDLVRFAKAVIAVANDETDPVYRDGYTMGRTHAGAEGWSLRNFTAVFTTSDGSDRPVNHLRCSTCNGLVQGVGPHTLIDLMALASRHECEGGAE